MLPFTFALSHAMLFASHFASVSIRAAHIPALVYCVKPYLELGAEVLHSQATISARHLFPLLLVGVALATFLNITRPPHKRGTPRKRATHICENDSDSDSDNYNRSLVSLTWC